jgi:hypothetical protein
MRLSLFSINTSTLTSPVTMLLKPKSTVTQQITRENFTYCDNQP